MDSFNRPIEPGIFVPGFALDFVPGILIPGFEFVAVSLNCIDRYNIRIIYFFSF